MLVNSVRPQMQRSAVSGMVSMTQESKPTSMHMLAAVTSSAGEVLNVKAGE